MSSKRGPRRARKARATADAWKASVDAPLQALLERPDTPALLAQTLVAIPWQARSVTPLRRVVASPGFAPQALAALLVLGGSVASDKAGAGTAVPLEDILAADSEIAPSEIRLALAGQPWGSAWVARTPADSPIVAAFAVVQIGNRAVEQARIALTGVWPQPVRLAESAAQLAGRALTEETIAAAAAAVAEECSPPSDFLGSEEYRRAMAAVTTSRALAACAERAVHAPEAAS